jgi:hypothetical protein
MNQEKSYSYSTIPDGSIHSSRDFQMDMKDTTQKSDEGQKIEL